MRINVVVVAGVAIASVLTAQNALAGFWGTMPGCARSIAQGPDFDIWVVGCDDPGPGGAPIYRYDGGNEVFQQIPGPEGMSIGACPNVGGPCNSAVWMTDAQGLIYSYNRWSNTFSEIDYNYCNGAGPLRAKAVAYGQSYVALGGVPWLIDTYGNIIQIVAGCANVLNLPGGLNANLIATDINQRVMVRQDGSRSLWRLNPDGSFRWVASGYDTLNSGPSGGNPSTSGEMVAYLDNGPGHSFIEFWDSFINVAYTGPPTSSRVVQVAKDVAITEDGTIWQYFE